MKWAVKSETNKQKSFKPQITSNWNTYQYKTKNTHKKINTLNTTKIYITVKADKLGEQNRSKQKVK